MATVIDSLLVSLGFDADVGGANRFDASLNNVLGTIGKISTAIVGAGTLISGFAVGFTLDNAAAIDETERLAMVANVTTQELQYLTAGADRFSISQEKLSDMLKDVNDKMGDFISSGGGEMKDFFENIANDIGITAESFKNLSGQDALQLYYDTLERANLSQSQMTFYMEAIANDATMLIPLLKNSGEEFTKWGDKAVAAGLVMSESQLEANKVLIENQKQVKIMMQGVKQSVSTAIAPLLNHFFDFLFLNQPQIDRFIAYFGDKFESLASTVSGNMDRVVSVFDLLFDSLFELWDGALWARDGLIALSDRLGITEHRGEILAGVIALITANLVGLMALKIVAFVTSLFRAFMLLFSPLAAVGVLLIGFLLIVQDIYGYLNGQDSVFAQLIEDYPLLGSVFSFVINNLELILSLLSVLTGAYLMMKAAAIGGFLLSMATGLASYAMLAAGAIAAGLATAAAWVVAFAPFLLIAAVIAAVIASFWLIYSNWSKVWQGVKDIASEAINYVKSAVEGVIGLIKDLFSYTPLGMAISATQKVTGMLAGNTDDADSAGMAENLLNGGKQFLSAHNANYNANNSGRPSYVQPMGGQASVSNESTVTQHINVNSAAEAAIIASRTAQGTRERTNGYQ